MHIKCMEAFYTKSITKFEYKIRTLLFMGKIVN